MRKCIHLKNTAKLTRPDTHCIFISNFNFYLSFFLLLVLPTNRNMINLQEEFISKLKLLLTQQQKNNSNNGKDSKRLSSNSVEGKHQIPSLSSSSSCIIQSSQWNPMGNILVCSFIYYSDFFFFVPHIYDKVCLIYLF